MGTGNLFAQDGKIKLIIIYNKKSNKILDPIILYFFLFLLDFLLVHHKKYLDFFMVDC